MKFIITSQHKGEPAKDWLICWTYKSALMQAHYRTKLDCGSSIVWGVRAVKPEHEPARLTPLPFLAVRRSYETSDSSSK